MTGVGRYFHSLLRELVPLDPAISYTLFLKEEVDPALPFANLAVRPLPGPGGYFRWQNTCLRRAVRDGGFDLFWSPNYTLPLFLRLPSLVTVHDVSWETQPQDYPPLVRLHKTLAGRWAMKRARRVLTVSEFSRREIIGLGVAAPEKVACIHEGVSAGFRRAAGDEVAAFQARWGISGKRVLGFLGSFFRRRHVADLIAAMDVVRRRCPDAVLLLVGENFAVPPAILASLPPHVVWIRRLPEEELNAFYSSLNLFLYLSEYEGFGLPPMEALNCGVIPLLLPQASLPEIYEGVALFVGQSDPPLVAEAVCRFLEQGDRAGREMLERWQAKKGHFTWKRAAAEHLRVLRGLS